MANNSSFYSRIAYSTGKYMALKNVFMVITGLFGIFIVRLLGPYEYGRYSLVWQLIGTIGPIVSLGWMTSLSKFIPEKTDPREKSLIFSQSASSVMLVWLVSGTLFMVLSIPLSKFIPVEIRNIKLMFVSFILITALFNISEGMFRGLGKFNEFTIVDGLRSNLGNALAIILIVLGLRTYNTIIFSNFVFSAVFIIGLAVYLKKHFHFTSLKIDPAIAKFTLTVFAGQILFLMMYTIDFVLLRILLKDPSQIGFYSTGIRIPNMLQTMLITPLSIPFLYYFSHNEGQPARDRIFELGTKYLGLAFALIALFIFSFSREIILVLFGSAYSSSIHVLRISALSLFLLGFTALFTPYFNSINRPSVMLIVSCITFASLFASNRLLIPGFKSLGPAISTIISLSIQTTVFMFFLPASKANFFKNFILTIFGISIAVCSGIFIHSFLALPVFIITVIAARLFTMKDIENLKKIIRKKED